MCTICAGVDKVSDYFESGKLKVSKSNLDEFTTDTSTAITCMESAFNDSTTIEGVVDEIVTYYTQSGTCTSDTIASMKEAINNIITNNPVSANDSTGSKKCTGLSLFTQSTTCIDALNGDSNIDTEANSYTTAARFLSTTNEMTRLLADT